MKTTLLILIAFILFSSCKKENDVVPQAQNQTQVITCSIPAPELLGKWKIINSTTDCTMQFLYPGGNNLFLIETIYISSAGSYILYYDVTDVTDSTFVVQKTTPELMHYSIDDNFLTIEGALVFVKLI